MLDSDHTTGISVATGVAQNHMKMYLLVPVHINATQRGMILEKLSVLLFCCNSRVIEYANHIHVASRWHYIFALKIKLQQCEPSLILYCTITALNQVWI